MQKSVDICLTDLLVGKFDHRFPWQDRFAARSWYDLISQSRFDEVRDKAKQVYASMEASNCLCPTVGWDGHTLTLQYHGGEHFVKWIIQSDERPAFITTLTRIMEVIEADRCLSLEAIVKTLGSFLNGEDKIHDAMRQF